MELIKSFLNSRKFWIFMTGLITILGAAYQDGVISSDEITKLGLYFTGYMASIAFEDGMSRRGGTGEVVIAPDLKVGEVVETKTQSIVEKSNA